ncbi:MAG: M28 family peptidase [Lentisphaeria bacterium]
MKPICDANIRSSLDYTQELIDKHGPRPSGTKACRDSAKDICRKLAIHCDSTKIESFWQHPDSFLSFFKVIVATYPVGILFLYWGNAWTFSALALFCAGTIFFMVQFMVYGTCFDFLFRKKLGCNVVGILEPKNGNEAKKQIVISGHHDSAWIFNFLQINSRIYLLLTLSGITVYAAALILSCYEVASLLIPELEMNKSLRGVCIFVFFCFTAVVIPFYFFKGRKASPGAGDDLIASSMLVELAEVFSREKTDGNPLEKTRLWFVSFDGEEAGLRGSKAFVRRHKKDLRAIPTCNFNMDSIYSLHDLTLLTSDLNGLVKTSKAMAAETKAITEKLGYTLKLSPMPLGGGATDAAEFALGGCEAVCLIAMQTSLKNSVAYHTSRDIVSNIEPECIGAVMATVYHYVKMTDSKN